MEDRSADVQKLRGDLELAEEENARLSQTKVGAETDIDSLQDSKIAAQRQADALLEQGDRLKKDKEAAEAQAHDAELDAAALNRRLQELEVELDTVNAQRAQNEQALDAAAQTKRMSLTETDSLRDRQAGLMNEKDTLERRTRDMDQELRVANSKLDDVLALIDSKDKELRTVETGASYAETKEFEAREETKKLKQENDVLQILLDKYRGDVDREKRMRDAEAERKYQLEDEKKRLAREALLKDMEARSAKQELERIRDTHDQLLDEKLQTSQELDAIKEHTELLQSQNASV